MLRYAIQKFLSLALTLYLIVTVTFILMKAIPGDPFTQETALPQEVINALKAHYKLDTPWIEQYGNYLYSVLTWNLGPSFRYTARTVNSIISEGFPVSAILGLEAIIIALSVGLTLGIIAALKHKHWLDHTAMIGAVLGISIPNFLLAALLQYLFAIKLSWLPIARWGTFAHTILPALSLAALPTAFIARLTRASLLEVLQQDYLKTAKAKGLSSFAIIMRHGLRNALLPVLSYLPPMLANVLIGSFVVEKIFGIPGVGQWFVLSVANRDYTLIMGMTVFYSLILLSAMFIMDIVYGLVDPRIKLIKKEKAYL
jgi:oligopeptide transport system permease protein